MSTIEGFDVSHHNAPASIPWKEAAFGFVRVSYGLGVDKAALEHLSRALQAEVVCLGAYHYLRGDRSGITQAEHFFDRVRTLEGGMAPLALALDLEDLPLPSPGWARPDYAATATAFLRRLRQLTRRPCAIYGSPEYLATLPLPGELVGPLWVAHWGVSSPKVVHPWEDWTIHQYSNTGGTLDRNRFKGSRERWGELFLPAALPLSPIDVQSGELAERVRLAVGVGPDGFTSRDEGPMISDVE